MAFDGAPWPAPPDPPPRRRGEGVLLALLAILAMLLLVLPLTPAALEDLVHAFAQALRAPRWGS